MSEVLSTDKLETAILITCIDVKGICNPKVSDLLRLNARQMLLAGALSR